MQELLNKLFSSEMLTESTKNDLMEAFAKQIKETKDAAREEAIVEVKAEYAAQFVADKEALVEALDTKVEEFLKGEFDELKEDIERFRDLEAEHATKLVEARAEMAKVLESDLNELVSTIDTFLEMRLAEEMKELKEDIEIVKQNELGRKIFETFKGEFAVQYAKEDDTLASLTEAQAKLTNTQRQLAETKKTLDSINRTKELDKVLESLHGRPREIMEAILKSVQTDKLSEAYDKFIGRVLHESSDVDSKVVTEKEKTSDSSEKVLAEKKNVNTKVVEEKTVNITGNTETIVEAKSSNDTSAAERLRKLAGI